MITDIRNIKIDAALLKSKTDEQGMVSDTVQLSLSYETEIPFSELRRYSLRLCVSTAKESSRVMDYVSQRYNEFLESQTISVSTFAYNDYLLQVLKDNAGYLSVASPFSMFSTNQQEKDLVITKNVSKLGSGQIIPKDLILFDINLKSATMTSGDRRSLLQSIVLDLPEIQENMSCYCYVYDNTMPLIFADSLEDNLSLNTEMTMITRSTFLGERTMFVPISAVKPFVGMVEKSTISEPDNDSLKTIDEEPESKVVQKYTSIFNSVSKVFESSTVTKNYDINKVLNNKNYFTDFWLTKDDNDNNRFIFSFDIRSYLMDNGIFPFVYKNSFLANAVINGNTPFSPSELSSVSAMKVYRNTVRNTGVTAINKLGTTGPGVLPKSDGRVQKISVKSVKRVNIKIPNGSLNNRPGLTFFEGCDKFSSDLMSNAQITGDYQYSAEVSVTDKSPEMMRVVAQILYGYKSELATIHDLLVSDSSGFFGDQPTYDLQTGRLTRDVRSIILNLRGTEVSAGEAITKILEDYENFVNSVVPSTDQVQIEQFFTNKMDSQAGLIDPKILKDIELIIDLGIRFVYDNLITIFPNDPYGSGQNSNINNFDTNASRSTRRNIFSLEHRFSEVFNRGKDVDFGIDYIFDQSQSADSLRSINISELTNRREEEFRKYFFSTNGSLVIPEGPYEDSSYAYFTPKIIRTPGREVINQVNFAAIDGTSIEYDFDRYGQLYTDLASLQQMINILGETYPTLKQAISRQSENNKIYSSALTLLQESYGVSINETVIPQFSGPKVLLGDIKTTLYDMRLKDKCGANGGLLLFQSIIGGESTQVSTTTDYFNQVNSDAKNNDQQNIKGSLDQAAIKNDLKDRAIKLPFAILGELTINKSIQQTRKGLPNTFNSLSTLRKILDISQKNITQKITSDMVSVLPNQLKNMIVVTSTVNGLSLGNEDGSNVFDARRFKLEEETTTEGEDLVTFFSDNQAEFDVYPQTPDPMKSYAKFLTFWMNYRKIAVVEYLDNFGTVSPINQDEQVSQVKYKLSNWKKLTPQIAGQLESEGGSILCRVRSLTTDDYLKLLGDNITSKQKHMMIGFLQEKDILELPTYNQYFYISNEASDSVDDQEDTTSTPETIETTAVAASEAPAPASSVGY